MTKDNPFGKILHAIRIARQEYVFISNRKFKPVPETAYSDLEHDNKN